MNTKATLGKFLFVTLLSKTILILFLPQSIGAQDEFVSSILEADVRMDVIAQEKPIPKLLRKYKPRAYVAPGSYRPINFYDDYLPKTVIRNSNGTIVLRSPDRSELKDFHDRNGHYLDYQIPTEEALAETTKDVSPTYYARIYRDTFTYQRFQQSLIFLKYTPVFPYSGLASKMSWWKKIASRIAGDPYGWHELDIHGAIMVILRATDCRPLGLVLSQHNYHRVYWRGLDFDWPEKNRPIVSYAEFSNEPYLITDQLGSRTARTVGDPRHLSYLYNRTDDAPLGSGRDAVISPEDGAERIPMKLEMLPRNDPLYTSQIPLGDKMNIFYVWSSWFREGPPGINFYAPPGLINLADLTAFYDIDREDDKFFSLLGESEFNLETFPPEKIMMNRKRKMMRRLQKLNEIYPSTGTECMKFRSR